MDEHVGARAARQAGGEAERADLKTAQRCRMPRRGAQMGADEHRRMVLQVAADSRKIRPHFDADLAEMTGWSDPGLHQHGGRKNSATAQDDLAGAKLPLLTVHRRLD